MALMTATTRTNGHPPAGMPDYDDLCEDLTYDELTDGLSTCSGSVNDLLDQLEEDDFRDSNDTSALDDLCIPDQIDLNSLHNGFSKAKNLGTFPSKTSQNGAPPPTRNSQGFYQDNAAKSASSAQLPASATKYGASTNQHKANQAISGPDKNPGLIGEFMQVRSQKFSSTNGYSTNEKESPQRNSTNDSQYGSMRNGSNNVAITSFGQNNNNSNNNRFSNTSSNNNSYISNNNNNRFSNSSSSGSANNTIINNKNNNNSPYSKLNHGTIQQEQYQQQQQMQQQRQQQQHDQQYQQQQQKLQNQQQQTSFVQNFTNNKDRRGSSAMSSPRSSIDGFQGSGRTKTCPSPSFDARSLKSAKWSSTEEINYKEGGSFKDIPKAWTPRNQPSPFEGKDFKPIGFDSNSLKRVKRSVSTDSAYNSPDPKDSFAWKDSTLDRQLKELKARSYSDAPEPKHNRDNDNSLGRTLENWKQTPLPKIEDPDVILLKKARQEKKVKRYLEDNFQNRHGNQSGYDTDSEIGALQAKYHTLDSGDATRSSPPRSPPTFSKRESRFEREQRIKVGSLDSFTPGETTREHSLSPPPAASSAQEKYEKERFRVQPGRIEDYRPGRCSVNQRSSTPGCGITKYASSHSFNPLLSSKSEHNLAVKKEADETNNYLQRSIRDGYESDNTLSFRKHNYNPQTAPKQAKHIYNQVQKGGEVPVNGLRMSEKEAEIPSIRVFMGEGEGRPISSASSRGVERWIDMREQETEEDIKRRQQQQLNQFYSTLPQHKEGQHRRDQESRKHHDTLLPSQKSPVPLNRYEEENGTGNQAIFLNAGKKPDDCKFVSRALYSFQAQNHRELSFKKGDIIYIKKQIDGNWYEGERNASVGIFPVSYVEILSSEATVTKEITRSLTRKEKTREGRARAKFSFTAQTPMELSLVKGESLSLTRRIDNNWFEGRVGSRKGIFPVSYVEVMQEPGTEESGTMKSTTSGSVTTGGSSSILKSGSLPTYAGYDKQRSGGALSPYSTLSSRPTSAQSNHQPPASDKPEPAPFRAVYNYKPQNEDEVELCEGDVVFVMEKCDDGWYVGTSQRTGIFGTFPGNYVTQV